MSSTKFVNDLAALHLAIDSLSVLLHTFQRALEAPSQPRGTSGTEPNPLALISDTAKLTKANTTKLSLLILNSPFSAKEVIFILNALSERILPALMSTVELCSPEIYTLALNNHVRSSLRVVFQELILYLRCIPEYARGARNMSQSTLASTGVLWEHCDRLIELGQKGMIWFLDEKIKTSGELLADAILELEDWDPDETDSEEDDGEGEESRIKTPTTSDEEALGNTLGNLTLSSQAVLKIKVLKHLRLVRLLYPALRKRRIATYEEAANVATEEQARNLNAMVEHAQGFSELADELACLLYEGGSQVPAKLKDLVDEVKACAKLTRLNWHMQPDAFTTWIDKWLLLLEELK